MPREPIPSVALLKEIPPFEGFPQEGRRFLAGLALNNERAWFDAHRESYETHVLAPLRAFVVEAGRRLRPQVPRIVADPRVGGSLFRIARDTRFSSDKSPYKSWAAARLWDGAGPGKEASPSFYIHLDAESVYAGGGIYAFTDEQLEQFRKALGDPKALRALQRILEGLELDIGGEVLKRLPRGFDADHPGGALLRHKGLYAGTDLRGHAARGARVLESAVEVYERLVPLNRWLLDHVVLGGER
jgi:uncharacterized protein (TIGR02453 family)